MRPVLQLAFVCIWPLHLLVAEPATQDQEASEKSLLPPVRTAIEESATRHNVQLRDNFDQLILGGQAFDGKLALLSNARLESSLGGSFALDSKNLAGLAGGGGTGRVHRAYFRDGTVLSGKLYWDRCAFGSRQMSPLDLHPDSLEVLFLKNSGEAPAIPPGRRNLALEAGHQVMTNPAPRATITLLGKWGTIRPPLEKIRRVWQTLEPTPQTWVELTDGAQLNVWTIRWQGDVSVQGESIPIDEPVLAAADSWENLQQLLSMELHVPTTPSDPDRPAIQLLDDSSIPLATEIPGIKFRDSPSGAVVRGEALTRITRVSPLAPPMFEFARTGGLVTRGQPVTPVFNARVAGDPLALPWHLIQEITFPAPAKSSP